MKITFFCPSPSRQSDRQPVPCTEWPEPWAGSIPPCPRSSRPSSSVWLRPRCCRPPRPTVGSSRSPPATPAPPWSRRPCSRSSPRRRRVRPWCRPAGIGPWRWRRGPPLAAAWCFPPAGGAGRCCEVAGGKKQKFVGGYRALNVAKTKSLWLFQLSDVWPLFSFLFFQLNRFISETAQRQQCDVTAVALWVNPMCHWSARLPSFARWKR